MDSILYKNGSISDLDETKGIVKGYGSIFGNMDSDQDIITKGAYTKTISENRSRIKYYKQHDISAPIGLLDELYEDEKGLAFTAKLALKTIDGQDVMEQIKFGLISENSVGISAVKKQQKDGFRELTELKLYEISAVSLAANPLATITDAKSQEQIDYISKRFENLASILRKGNISDELGYALEFELLTLKDTFLNVTKPANATKPTTEVAEEELYKHLIKNLNP
tara:strand:+ start:9529 stop:10203 length:675 start_codon:yes stop_codon:yes gene_type:complete